MEPSHQTSEPIPATISTSCTPGQSNIASINCCPCPFGGEGGGGGMEKSGNTGTGGGHLSAMGIAVESCSNVGMSRPSLISSLWSIQVQNEGSSSDFPMAFCGSQQSLPEMLNQAGATLPFGGHPHCNGLSGDDHEGIVASTACGAVADGLDQMQTSAEMLASGIGDGGGGCGTHQMDLQTGTAIIGGGAGGPQSGQMSLRPVKSLSDLHTLTAAQIAQTVAATPCPHHFHQQPQLPIVQSYLGFRRQTETGPYYTTMLSRQQRDSLICEWLQKLNMNGGGGGGAGSTSGGGSESPSQEFYPQRPPRFMRADTTEQ